MNVQDCVPAVHAAAVGIHKGCSTIIDLDDLVGEGFLGLMEAASRFDSSRGTTLLTFAWRRITGRMHGLLSKAVGTKTVAFPHLHHIADARDQPEVTATRSEALRNALPLLHENRRLRCNGLSPYKNPCSTRKLSRHYRLSRTTFIAGAEAIVDEFQRMDAYMEDFNDPYFPALPPAMAQCSHSGQEGCPENSLDGLMG